MYLMPNVSNPKYPISNRMSQKSNTEEYIAGHMPAVNRKIIPKTKRDKDEGQPKLGVIWSKTPIIAVTKMPVKKKDYPNGVKGDGVMRISKEVRIKDCEYEMNSEK